MNPWSNSDDEEEQGESAVLKKSIVSDWRSVVKHEVEQLVSEKVNCRSIGRIGWKGKLDLGLYNFYFICCVHFACNEALVLFLASIHSFHGEVQDRDSCQDSCSVILKEKQATKNRRLNRRSLGLF